MLFTLAGLLPAMLVPNVPPREGGLSRRSCVGVGALAALSCCSPLPAQARMSAEEMDARDAWSRTAPAKGVVLPSGVRVIDMQEGTGPLPVKGDRVWCHFKAWPRGFRSNTTI